MTTQGSGASAGVTARAGAKAPKMPVKRRLILIATVLVVIVLPMLAMLLVTWLGTGKVQGAATWASIPALVGIAAAMAGGRRYAVIVAIVMGFLGPLAIVAGLREWGCRGPA